MQFLQQLNRNGETGVQKIKEFIQGNIVSIVIISACAFFVLGCWLLYTANRTANDYHDVTDTVQSIESDNREARQQIGNASAEINNAEKQLNNSIKRTGEITNRVNNAKKRVDGNAEIARECETVIESGRRDTEEARNIFNAVDERNKISGAPADGA